ncbi:MAG: hypothetical protein RXR08_11920 [Sulfolobaceae archaeon]
MFANYTPLKIDPENKIYVAKVNTTGQIIEIRDVDLSRMMGYVRLDHPGATVEEVANMDLAEVVKQTGDFKDDD